MNISLDSRDAASDKIIRNLRIIIFPRYAVYFIVSILSTFTVANIVSRIWTEISVKRWAAKRLKDSSDKEARPGSEGVKLHPNISLRRLPLAALEGIRIVSFRVTLPFFYKRYLMSETFASLGYMFSMLMFVFCGSRNSDGDIDPRFYADRAGVIAISQLTFVIALAGKNNIISLLTGISYEKLNILHRAASYTLLILIWVHFWGRTSLVLTGIDSMEYFYIKSGVVSGTTFTLLVILGTRLLRSWDYEFFVANHYILSLVLLVFLHFHVNPEAFPGFYVYTWPPFVPWGVDRLLRLIRVLHIRYLCYKSSGSRGNARLEVLSVNTLRVRVRLAHTAILPIRWRAGQSAFLSVPVASRFGLSLEAHPFTIATIDSHSDDPENGGSYLEMMFIVRSREGFTQRLYEFAKLQGGMCSMSTYVDGPYGEPPSLRGAPRVILIAGGSGVSFTLPLLLDLSRLSKSENTICTRVFFVWYIRNTGCIDWISEALSDLLQSIPPRLEISIRILITGTKDEDFSLPALDPSDGGSKKGSNSEKVTSPISETSSEELGCRSIPPSTTYVCESPIVTVTRGRPNVAQILEEEILAYSSDVTACVSGPQSLIDDVRLALRKPNLAGPMNVLHGGANIILHVETFGM